MKLKKTCGTFALSLILAACAEQDTQSDSTVDPAEVSVESAVALISGINDEQAGSAFAVRTPVNWKQAVLLPQAFASNCLRAVYSPCVSGVRSAQYSSCSAGLANYSMNGNVALSYSNSTCDLGSLGASVNRTYAVTVEGPRGGQLLVTSQSRADYNNQTYGGGGRLTTTVNGWNLEVLGKHKTLSYRGRTLFDVSIRTLSPIAVTGSLSRASRNVNSGQLQVNHNLAKLTSTITPQNLQWNNSCCHPISGSLAVSWTGSRTGSATVTFSSCGQAELSSNGQTQNITLSYCE